MKRMRLAMLMWLAMLLGLAMLIGTGCAGPSKWMTYDRAKSAPVSMDMAPAAGSSMVLPPPPDQVGNGVRGAARRDWQFWGRKGDSADKSVVAAAGAPLRVASTQPATAAENTALATATAPKPEVKPAPNRKVIYTAELSLQVASRDRALEQIQALIQRFDGFVQHATLASVTFRVAPERFSEAIKALAGMGQVLSREISTQDVTEQYVDVEMRIKTAEESRDRLRALLAKAVKTEDLLKIESDIRRLTEEIEVMKGRLRVLADQVDLSTITVNLSERPVVVVQQPTRWQNDRFAWISAIGIDNLQQPVPTDGDLSGTPWLTRFFAGPAFRLAAANGNVVPEGFVPLYSEADRVLATTPEDFRMRVLLLDIPQPASLGFWAETLKAELGQRRGYAISEIGEAKLKDKALEGRVLRATVNQGGESWDYNLWIVRRRDMPERMAVVEYACVGQTDTRRERVAEAVSGMKLRPSMWKAPFTQGCLAAGKLFE